MFSKAPNINVIRLWRWTEQKEEPSKIRMYLGNHLYLQKAYETNVLEGKNTTGTYQGIFRTILIKDVCLEVRMNENNTSKGNFSDL